MTKANLKLLPFRHLWGVTDPLEAAAAKFQQRGYAGIESHFGDAAQRRAARQLLESLGMKNIAFAFTQPHLVAGHTVSAHLESLHTVLQESLETNPVLINVHAGWDAWSESETLEFFTAALNMVSPLPVPVGFETHPGAHCKSSRRCLSCA